MKKGNDKEDDKNNIMHSTVKYFMVNNAAVEVLLNNIFCYIL